MAFKIKTLLLPKITTSNGTDSIQFIENDCTYQEDDVTLATPYYNPVTGTYDETKSTLHFNNGEQLIIKQTYNATELELNA